MSRTQLVASVIGIVVVVILVTSTFFIVNQAEKVLVVRFGEVRQTIDAPGLHVKVPFIDQVARFDARLLDVDPPPEEVILGDQKRVVVDTYTRYRISDPLQFFRTVRNEDGVTARLREIVNNALRKVLGTATLPSVLSPDREEIMHRIQQQVSEAAKPFGVAVVDVRIRRADLPPETSQSIYKRMQSERQREAAEARAEGQQKAQEIRAGADRDRTVILAEAQKQAEILRGEGDGQASTIYAQAFGQDPQFFAFYRSLQAYRKSLGSGDTTYLLAPDSDFLKYFEKAPQPQGGG
jgi:membrane protease subunit HflC